MENNEPLKIDLRLHPTGGLKDVRYSIKIIGDSLISKNYFPQNNFDKSEYKDKLNSIQIKKINELVSLCKRKKINKEISILDSWGATLIINGETYYQDDNFSFGGEPKDIKQLINYLVELSQIKIELYGFA